MSRPKRGEIYLVDFSPSIGKEMRKVHPALVIQNDIGNRASALTIVAAITSTRKVAQLPVGVLIEPEESGVDHTSAVHLGHIYTVDQLRLRTCIGKLSEERMAEVDHACSRILEVPVPAFWAACSGKIGADRRKQGRHRGFLGNLSPCSGV